MTEFYIQKNEPHIIYFKIVNIKFKYFPSKTLQFFLKWSLFLSFNLWSTYPSTNLKYHLSLYDYKLLPQVCKVYNVNDF